MRWLLFVLAACSAAPAPVARRPAPTGTWDAGEFALTQKGRAAGTETFAIERSAGGFVVRSSTMLEYADGAGRLIESELTTDAAWRPLAATVRDAKDGVTVSTLAGAPLHLAVTVAGVAARDVAGRDRVDLFLGEYTSSHFAPACTLPGAAARIAFPGMVVAIGAPVPIADDAVTRRIVDLGGATRVDVYCDGTRLVAVDTPFTDFAAVRTGYDLSALRPAPREPPALPDGVTELDREVTVRAGKGVEPATLACSLAVPPGDHRAHALPAVILITGSGAQDRDENAVGGGGVEMSGFRVLAGALAAAGIASLRCDDRGTGESTGAFGDATLDTFVADAAAMVAALRAEPMIDPARVGAIGHSEGGVIAPILAARDRRLRAIALLAAPGRPLDVVLLEQYDRAQRRLGATDADRTAAVDRYRAVFAAIRAGTALPDTTEGREWAGGEAWLRSHLAHDPIATARTLRRPAVLVAQGELDQQVTVADADALVAALRAAGNDRITDRRYPTLNHLFAASATGAVSEYVDPDATLDAGLVADLVAFVTGAL